MKVNWLLRLKNKATIIALIAVVYEVARVFGFELPIAETEIKSLVDMVFIALISLGVVVDPTTKGVSDSEQALNYTNPK